MNKYIIIFSICSVTYLQNVFADGDIVTDATKICMQKNDLPLTKCPEYVSAINKTMETASNAVNDPKLKAQNQAAINQAVKAAGVSNPQ